VSGGTLNTAGETPAPAKIKSAACWSVFHSECADEIVAGLGNVRFEADGFLELADCVFDPAFIEESDATRMAS
jgi:hypothetical protein